MQDWTKDAKQVDLFWQRSQGAGINRRDFLKILAAASASVTVAACTPQSTAQPTTGDDAAPAAANSSAPAAAVPDAEQVFRTATERAEHRPCRTCSAGELFRGHLSVSGGTPRCAAGRSSSTPRSGLAIARIGFRHRGEWCGREGTRRGGHGAINPCRTMHASAHAPSRQVIFLPSSYVRPA